MRIAAAQINPTVGDFTGNAGVMKEYIGRAREAGAALIVFPRMAVCGYPARDFLDKAAFLDAGIGALCDLAQDIAVLTGVPLVHRGFRFNAAVLLQDGRGVDLAACTPPPDGDVFDEARYFPPGPKKHSLYWDGLHIGVTAGDWDPDPMPANLAVHLAASPYHQGVQQQRLERAGGYAARYGCPQLYVNQVGGNDELVFDGASFLLNARGEPVLTAREFEADLLIFNLGAVGGMPVTRPDWTEGAAQIHQALVLGLRDYFRKTGFTKALIGLSGGIDSAVAAVLAAAALGAENVRGVNMPSRYSSASGVEDARELAARLGIGFELRPIESHFRSFISEFNPDGEPLLDVAEENIQARIRGDILMFLANREGYLVLNASNKSETAIGYTTLYGDMAAALGVLSDVTKTLVYELAVYINRDEELIPDRIIRKPPSAELAPGQLDENSLPPYSVLDGILEAYIEEGCSPAEITARGYDEAVTRRIIRLVERAEHKRRQAAPGLRVTAKAFGRGRRFPIAHRWIP